MEFDLPLIWFGIIIFATLMYIVMDGFDLGIGILFPFIHDEDDRDIMVNTVAPRLGWKRNLVSARRR